MSERHIVDIVMRTKAPNFVDVRNGATVLKKARVDLFKRLERALAQKCDALHTSPEDVYDEWDKVVHANLRMLWAAHDTNRDGALEASELRVFVTEPVGFLFSSNTATFHASPNGIDA